MVFVPKNQNDTSSDASEISQDKQTTSKDERNNYNIPSPLQKTKEQSDSSINTSNTTSFLNEQGVLNEPPSGKKYRLKRVNPSINKSTIYYRKTKRSPLLTEIVDKFDKFCQHTKDLDGPAYYSSIKDTINQIWSFVDEEEYFGILLSTLESILYLNSWRSLSDKQLEYIKRIVLALSEDHIEASDITRVTTTIQNTKLKFIPYEEKEE